MIRLIQNVLWGFLGVLITLFTPSKEMALTWFLLMLGHFCMPDGPVVWRVLAGTAFMLSGQASPLLDKEKVDSQ